jgi:uncharacterized protein
VRFWDSSALVPLLVEEEQSEQISALFDADPSMIVWWATELECLSALARRDRSGELAADEMSEALRRLGTLTLEWREVVPDDIVRRNARHLLRVHDLRVADALQLAAARVATDEDPFEEEFVCLDARLSRAAQLEGFQIVPQQQV